MSFKCEQVTANQKEWSWLFSVLFLFLWPCDYKSDLQACDRYVSQGYRCWVPTWTKWFHSLLGNKKIEYIVLFRMKSR